MTDLQDRRLLLLLLARSTPEKSGSRVKTTDFKFIVFTWIIVVSRHLGYDKTVRYGLRPGYNWLTEPNPAFTEIYRKLLVVRWKSKTITLA